MRCILCDRNRGRRFGLRRTAVASPGEMEGVVPSETYPHPCGSVPVSDDGLQVCDEESSCDSFPHSVKCPRPHAIYVGLEQMVP